VGALFGCGGDREREKRALMGKIAVENADFAVITSDNPRSEDPTDIINDILHGCEGAQNFAVIPNRKDAIEYVIATHRVGDIILLAGKGHENYEIDARGAHYFDEREVLGKAIEKYCK
jgi:UDP-N-acetylmuramoyl-L-alanyl-D-glutamate--2,6-diaminopimelate ligase